MKISVLACNAMVDALVDLIDAGTPPGTLEIRTGAAPTETTDSDSGTLLGTLTFDVTAAFGAAASRVATAAAITSDTNADASGTAAHFRIKNAAGVVIIQGTIGTSGSDINFDSVTIVAGATIACDQLTVTQPAT